LTIQLLRKTRKGITIDPRGEAVCRQLLVDVPKREKLGILEKSREKIRQIGNYEIRHKRRDECGIEGVIRWRRITRV
jgi:hypothetical protein